MLRYIIGITILTIGIIIVRALSNGKILRKYQYAFWIAIPLYMILMPFVKINVPVADIGNTLFTSNTEVATQEVKEAVPSTFMLGDMETEQSLSDNQSVVNHKIQRSSGISYEREHITDNHVDVSIIKTNKSGKIGAALKNSSILVSAILIIALAVYNTGFISYCKRNRKYIGRDPSSGLKIYSIRHKQTPFLLFNKIYVDNSSEKINDFVVCHEVSHYKHGDYLWVLIRYLVLFLNWYNPIIWLAFILSGRDCEYACDEEVMRAYGVDSYKEYARTLVGIPQQQANKAVFALSTGMRSGYKMMKKRIILLKGIFTKAENVSSTAKGFTLEEYKKFVRETLNGNDPIVNGQTVYFSMLFSGMSDEFISNGKVDLSKPEFKELADYIKDNVPENGSSLNAWYSSCYAESPLLKCDLTLGSGCTGINDFYDKGMGITPYGRGVTMLGFPSVDGRGPLFIPTCSVAVSTHAVDSKACGEFVKLLLSDDIQNEIAMNDRFVLSREAFKNAGAVAVEYYSNGGSGSDGNRIGNTITMQDIEFIENIILGCSRVKSEDPDISMILIEEMPPYFLGQKDLDAVIVIAENRIQKVLDERG